MASMRQILTLQNALIAGLAWAVGKRMGLDEQSNKTTYWKEDRERWQQRADRGESRIEELTGEELDRKTGLVYEEFED